MFGGDAFGDVLFANPGGGGHWLELRLVGRCANRSAIGARVRVALDDGDGRRRRVHRVVGTGSSFGANLLRLWIDLGTARHAEAVEITWPGGTRTDVRRHVDADQRLVIFEDPRCATARP